MYGIKAPWYSGHGLRLLHRRSRLDSHSRRFTWQVNEPSPGSTYALWGELGSQSKVLTGHWLTKIMSFSQLFARMGFSASCNSTIHNTQRLLCFRTWLFIVFQEKFLIHCLDYSQYYKSLSDTPVMYDATYLLVLLFLLFFQSWYSTNSEKRNEYITMKFQWFY